MTIKKNPFLLTALAILFWSTSATAFKIALQNATPFQLLWSSGLISMLALASVITIQKKWKMVSALTRREVFHLAILGFLNPFLYYAVLFNAYYLLPGQVAMSLNYAWPIMLTLLSAPILGHTLRPVHIMAILLSFGGVVIIATRGELTVFDNINSFGVILALTSTVIWAVFWLINAREKTDPVVRLFVGFGFGFFISVLYILFLKQPFWPGATAWPALVYVGLFEMGFTFVIWLMAVKAAYHAAEVGNLIYLTPFLSLIVLWLVLDEKIYLSTFIGLCFIVSGILLQQFLKEKILRN